MHPIFVGFRCNNRCSFCAQGDLRDRELDDCVEADLLGVTRGAAVAFVGGEPSVHDGLVRWVERARGLGAASIVIQTNGRRLGETGYAASLREAGVTSLDVSLHGSTPGMHDFHTSVPGSFVESTEGIRAARAAGLPVGVTTVVTRSNYRHLHEIVRLSVGLGAAAVHLAVAQRLGRARLAAPGGAAVVPPRALVRPHWAHALATAQALGVPCFGPAGSVTAEASGAAADRRAGWFAGVGVVDG